MTIPFHKYHGAGNDFIIVDNRSGWVDTGRSDLRLLVTSFCHRRYGIGADGMMLLQDCEDADFEMRYFNADGRPGSMCGNGGRCIAAYALHTGIVTSAVICFKAVDGHHQAEVLSVRGRLSQIRLQLSDAAPARPLEKDAWYVDTGSPHLVRFVERLPALDVAGMGRKARMEGPWAERGINVNFVEREGPGRIRVRTYERGVEDETLSCGTGVTAASIALWQSESGKCGPHIKVTTPGGLLEVDFTPPSDGAGLFTDLRLTGPAQFVFGGMMVYDP